MATKAPEQKDSIGIAPIVIALVILAGLELIYRVNKQVAFLAGAVILVLVAFLLFRTRNNRN